MSETCPTVKVKFGDNVVTINSSDYDPTVHELADPSQAPPVVEKAAKISEGVEDPTGACPTVKVKCDASPGGHRIINESDFDASVHEPFEALPAPPPPPGAPPPPPSGDPLDGLAENWREDHGARLKSIALAVSGRAVENKAQAIEVIEAALAARPQ